MLSDSTKLSLAGAAAVFAVTWWVWRYLRGSGRPGRALPGPPGLPIVGNARDVAGVDNHIAYSHLAKKYGPIMKFHVLGKTVIVISDAKTALDLLEKRGAIYSGRPKFYMAWESGFSWSLALMASNDTWRVRRQLVQQHFHAKSTAQKHALLRRTVLELAKNLLQTPHNFREHLQHSATSSIMNSVYGIVISAHTDPYAEIVERAMAAVAVIVPGQNLMDALPFLRHVPAWVPFLGWWTAQAQKTRKLASAMLEVPYARAKDDLRTGNAQPCMVHEALERLQTDSNITEQDIKAACAVSYFAGADTIVGTLLMFVMAMVLSPGCQAKAQAELDRVLGDRLPDFADQASLPYIEAIIRETYRRYPVGTLGVPHAVDEDNEYDGYFIRSGSIIMVNVWHIMHDAATYPEPEQFDPDRWLKNGIIDDNVQDPRIAVFGFGRRYRAVPVATSPKQNGVEVPPSGKIDTGLTSCPAPFKCRIEPRSTRISGMVDVALEACVE